MTVLRTGRVSAQLKAFLLEYHLPFLSSTHGVTLASLAFLAAGAEGEDDDGAGFVGAASIFVARFRLCGGLSRSLCDGTILCVA